MAGRALPDFHVLSVAEALTLFEAQRKSGL